MTIQGPHRAPGREQERKPLSTQTLSEAAAASIHEMIITGELEPGTPVRLVDLSQRLGTSVMPVREGLRKLEALGLVEIIPRRGAWVRELDWEDFLDTNRTRLTLESLAVRQAASRFTEDDARKARRSLENLVELIEVGEVVAARAAHAEFHFDLYAASGSRWLLRAIEPVWRNSERYRFGSHFTKEHLDRTRREHELILDACIAHDQDAAEGAFAHHLNDAMERITPSLRARTPRKRAQDGVDE